MKESWNEFKLAFIKDVTYSFFASGLKFVLGAGVGLVSIFLLGGVAFLFGDIAGSDWLVVSVLFSWWILMVFLHHYGFPTSLIPPLGIIGTIFLAVRTSNLAPLYSDSGRLGLLLFLVDCLVLAFAFCFRWHRIYREMRGL